MYFATTLDNKRVTEILRDVAEFREKHEMKVYHEDEKERQSSRRMERQKMSKCKQDHYKDRVKPDKILTHWPGWWQRMERVAESARRRLKAWNVTQPNIILTGWREWWSRMEAEGMRDKKQQNLIPVWIKSRIISIETNFFSKNFKNTSDSGQAKQEEKTNQLLASHIGGDQPSSTVRMWDLLI